MSWLGSAIGAATGAGIGSLSPFGAVGGVLGGIGGAAAGSGGDSSGGTSNGFPDAPDFSKIYSQPTDPSIAALQRRLDSMKAPTAVADNSKVYQAETIPTSLPEYDLLRQNTQNQIRAQQGTAQDQLDRRFAAMGGGPGGAQIKANLDLARQGQEGETGALNQIGFQEAQQRHGLDQAEKQRAFQSQEAANQRGLQAQEFNTQMGQNFNQFGLENSEKLAGLDLGYKDAQAQAAAAAFNAGMQGYQAKHSGGLLGSGGVLGTGLGPSMGSSWGLSG